jgi:predicted DNA-binding transcriptional regulator AlpA
MTQFLKAANEARILRLTQVKERTGLSRSTLYTLIKEGKFAPPILIGARAVGIAGLNHKAEYGMPKMLQASS